MAACDNLHGNAKQWQQLYDFLKEEKPEYLHYMMEKPDEGDEDDWRICYIASIQDYLIKECPFDWVKEKLDDCIFVQRMISGKANHERGGEAE